MGEDNRARVREVAALRLGIALGMTLIDTAEMYGDGGAEQAVCKAIQGQQQEVCVVTKVSPQNASRKKCQKRVPFSLKHLGIDAIDLYLLHWRERTPPLQETVETFELLRAAGKIKRCGVSNFDVDDMEELLSLEGGRKCAANQVLYNLQNREIEFYLLSFLTSNIKSADGRIRRGEPQTSYVPVMAYSPVGYSGRLLRNPALKKSRNPITREPARSRLSAEFRPPKSNKSLPML